jgi:hypothetical protein
MKLDLSFWKNASPRRKRIYSIIAIFLIGFMVTVIGSAIPLSHQDATTISQDLNATLNQHKNNNTLTEYIFINNFSICLLMFIPVVGAALGMFILFDTGIALGAISAIQGYPAYIGILSELITPVFWLEFAAYSIAMAESIWLFRRLTQRRWRELKWTGLFIAICAGLLAVGAVVEVWIITVLG